MIRAAVICLLLAGCAAQEPLVRTVEVVKLVSVPCAVQFDPDPEDATRAGKAADVFEAMKRSLATIERWEAWGKTARAAASKCQQTPSKEPRP